MKTTKVRPVYHTYYGTASRFLDSDYSVRIAITNNTNGQSFTDMKSHNEGLLYRANIAELHTVGCAIQDDGENGIITLMEKYRLFREEFIPRADEFIKAWGPEIVVWEDRKEITSVRCHLGLEVLEWPPINVYLAYGPQTDWITTPGRLDDWGKAILDDEGQVKIATLARLATPPSSP